MLPNPMLGTAKDQVQIHEPILFRDDWKDKTRSSKHKFPISKSKGEKGKAKPPPTENLVYWENNGKKNKKNHPNN